MIKVDEFVRPIVEDALKRKAHEAQANSENREILEGESLLDHLVRYTDGW